MRFLSIGFVVSLLILVIGCGPEKAPEKAAPYAELKDVYSRVSDAQDQLATGLSAAQDGNRVATVVRTYTAKMREVAPLLSAAQGKYPELGTASTPPAELAATVEVLNASTGRMMESLAKVQQYMDDPAVVAAMDELSKAARQ